MYHLTGAGVRGGYESGLALSSQSKKTTLKVRLENNPSRKYSAGDTIYGDVVLTNYTQIYIKSIIIKFRGHGRVRFTLVDTYLKDEFIWFREDNGQEVALSPGTTLYPFAFTLPTTCPTTFSDADTLGEIAYYMKAVVSLAKANHHHSNLTQTLPFTVQGRVDLNFLPETLHRKHFVKNLRWTQLARHGSADIHIRLPKTGFVIGENINFKIGIDNVVSSEFGSPRAFFVKKTTLSVNGRTIQDVKRIGYKKWSKIGLLGDNVDFNSSYNLEIPLVPPTGLGLGGCTGFNVEYIFQLELRMTSKIPCEVIFLQIPIVIATVGFDDRFTPNMEHNSAEHSDTHSNPGSASDGEDSRIASFAEASAPPLSMMPPPDYCECGACEGEDDEDLPPPTYKEAMTMALEHWVAHKRLEGS